MNEHKNWNHRAAILSISYQRISPFPLGRWNVFDERLELGSSSLLGTAAPFIASSTQEDNGIERCLRQTCNLIKCGGI